MSARILLALVVLSGCSGAAPKTEQVASLPSQPMPAPVIDSFVFEQTACTYDIRCLPYRISVTSTGQTSYQQGERPAHTAPGDPKVFRQLVVLLSMSDVLSAPKMVRLSDELCAEQLPASTVVRITIHGRNGIKQIEDDQRCATLVGPASGNPPLTPAERLGRLRGFEGALEQAGRIERWKDGP